MREVLGIDDNLYGDVLTSGRTDKKVNREDEHSLNDKYRSYVGTLNWLSMGLRYNIAFTTKELSRVLDKPTKIANEIVNRALIYSYRSRDAHLRFSSLLMKGCTPPKTRRKPNDGITAYVVEHYNTYDGITHVDDTTQQQGYTSLVSLILIQPDNQTLAKAQSHIHCTWMERCSTGAPTQKNSSSNPLPPANRLP